MPTGAGWFPEAVPRVVGENEGENDIAAIGRAVPLLAHAGTSRVQDGLHALSESEIVRPTASLLQHNGRTPAVAVCCVRASTVIFAAYGVAPQFVGQGDEATGRCLHCAAHARHRLQPASSPRSAKQSRESDRAQARSPAPGPRGGQKRSDVPDAARCGVSRQRCQRGVGCRERPRSRCARKDLTGF